jgi:hypothetical protein
VSEVDDTWGNRECWGLWQGAKGLLVCLKQVDLLSCNQVLPGEETDLLNYF